MKAALNLVPTYFRSETTINGIRATDLFTLSGAVSAAIEESVVATLNDLRKIWDPENEYEEYAFERQPQRFPDVLLKRVTKEGDSPSILLGIELKAWYLLAKEVKPTFRFKTTAAACAPQDIVCVVPWALSNVVSGTPKVYAPWIESAKYAALYRNWWWQYKREDAGEGSGDTGIDSPPGIQPYPSRETSNDVPRAKDTGKNFGRLARSGLMDAYLEEALDEELSGIKARSWRAFLRKAEKEAPRDDADEAEPKTDEDDEPPARAPAKKAAKAPRA